MCKVKVSRLLNKIKNKNNSFFKLIIFATIVYSSSLFAQVPSFINIEKNKLYFSKDSSAFLNFYKKIEGLKTGERNKVTIAHFGGSHIQAGFWSETLINGFQKLSKTTGGGLFVFPFKIAKTNSPHFYSSFTNGNWQRCRCALNKEMCEDLGMAGMAVITNDSANTFGFKLNTNTHHKNFNSVRVYHNFNASFEFGLSPQTTYHFIKKDFKEKGYSEFVFENNIDSINFTLIKKDSTTENFMLRGFSIESSNAGIYYASMGVNGASSNSFLRCSNFVSELKTLPPDLVIFSLGVNDTQGANFNKGTFKANYDSLISMIKLVTPNVAILFTTTTDNYIRRKIPNKRTVIAQQAIFELLDKHNAAVYDVYAVMGGYKSIYKWYKVGLANKDKVHFNGKGYNILSTLMFDAIERSYNYNSK